MALDRNHDLVIRRPITRWDEGIPLGNGLTGCLVWGDGSPLRFSLDRGDLWDTRTQPEWEGADYHQIIEAVRRGDQAGLTKRFNDSYCRATPTKIPAGRLELRYGRSCDGAESRLSLADAMADVRLFFGENSSWVRAYAHATERLICITISGDTTTPCLDIVPNGFQRKEGNASENDCSLLDYPEAEVGAEGDIRWILQKTCEELEFAVVLGARERAPGSLDAVCVVTASTDGADWLSTAKSRVEDALSAGFDALLVSHRKWWGDFWSKSAVSLCDAEAERHWYMENYLFGSCSRKGAPPMPLQGVWTADEGKLPPWKGDYHNDLNTQMSYWHFAKANHLEEGESFIDFLWNLVPKAREFAREFYDSRGLCFPAAMSIDGKPLGGWPMHGLSMTNSAWLCQVFDDYWLYTGDLGFLREKAYPFFKESAECIERWLAPGEDGLLRLPLSASPEIHDDSIEAWLTPNSNHDLSIMLYLFGRLADMAERLQNGEENHWIDILSRLPELVVDERGVLSLCLGENLRESHRHHSHAMGIYPLNLLNYYAFARDRAIIDSTIANLEMLGTGLWVGFSFPWMACFYARAGNGEGAAYQLKTFYECFCAENGFNLNGDFKKRGVSCFHYRPFTLEANMCAAAALQEMLLQTYGGVVRVFPAIPEEWRNSGVSFEGFRAEGGVIVSSAVKDNRIRYITLYGEKDADIAVANSFDTDTLMLGDGVIRCEIGGSFSLKLHAGENVIIRA